VSINNANRLTVSLLENAQNYEFFLLEFILKEDMVIITHYNILKNFTMHFSKMNQIYFIFLLYFIIVLASDTENYISLKYTN